MFAVISRLRVKQMRGEKDLNSATGATWRLRFVIMFSLLLAKRFFCRFDSIGVMELDCMVDMLNRLGMSVLMLPIGIA